MYISPQDYRAQHEPILYGWKEGKGKHFFAADRSRTTVWEISRDAQAAYIHPTQKPVALAEEAVVNSSKPGWHVADFFTGSGSTLIACEIGGRIFYGMDIDPAYAQVAIERWQTFTGKLATLDGKTLEQVAKERAKEGRNAKGNSRKPVSGKNGKRGGGKQGIRQGLHAGLPAPRGKPAGEPPVVAGDT